EVRIKLVALQRELAESENVIMDGRDIGTYVLPNADIKIFLTATVEARAKRRFEELSEKGVSTTFDDVKKDMEYRDKNDSGREFAPLKPAENCVFVDSTDMNLSETIEHIFNLINTTFKEIK
ncbi:MAG: (d)CMP kinase, partial [Oscillospiraceae bacterium]